MNFMYDLTIDISGNFMYDLKLIATVYSSNQQLDIFWDLNLVKVKKKTFCSIWVLD